METPRTVNQCLNCDRPETVVPLICLRYVGSEAWICSRCLPTLIHNPQALIGKLKGAEMIPPAPDH